MNHLKKYIVFLVLVVATGSGYAQQASWIWYPGDFETWMSNKMQNRRTDRNSFFPPFWKLDAHYVLMNFNRVVELTEPEDVRVYAEGTCNIKLDGVAFETGIHQFTVPKGRHTITVKVWNQANVPALFVQGKTIVSDTSWLVTFEDKEWIDETGRTSDISATVWMNAGSWNFKNPLQPPSVFHLPTRPASPVATEKKQGQYLVDFGKETFGFIKLHGLKGKGKISLYYGESKEEAQAEADAMTLDRLHFATAVSLDTTMPLSKAFRYVNIVFDPSITLDSASMLYEHAGLSNRGSFTCSDTLINRIYNVSAYTLELNTREFFIDGIKRDRWIWSGDASQSYLMNFYSYFDNPTVTRTMLALRGKDPVTSHINTIVDYTFYWFISVYDYYRYTGDKTFIKQLYPRMQTLMQYCLGRRNANGFIEGRSGDWTFIDWATGLSKKGEISFEQLLFARSLETMSLCATLADDNASAATYSKEASLLKQRIFDAYWNKEKNALVHSRVDGKSTANITRYANMFGIFFDYFDAGQKEAVKKQVLLNDSIQKITTPYMRFYELEALSALGEQAYVLQQMKNYWGGMLNLGATSFWEEYDPTKKGAEHLAMYGRKFGKSLCHAWGASPIYLLGRYFLGVSPTTPGYATYKVQPALGGLQWMQGKVPTPDGDIEVYFSRTEIKIKGATGKGTLVLNSKSKPSGKNVLVRSTAKNQYEVSIDPGVEYSIRYQAL
ncbi:MAG: alpha-L-rhamnosidase C-terminal domain-containing protein [Bacteroidota bacterium]